jgi:membrane dipeptidase
MTSFQDSAYIEALNDQIARHPTSFSGRMTKDILALHREAYPFDTHFDSISGRFQFGADFADKEFKPKLTDIWRIAAWILGFLLPRGKNKPLYGQANRGGFNLGFGGAISCGHAIPNNVFNRLAGDPWDRIVSEYENLKLEVEKNPSARLCASPQQVKTAKAKGLRSLVFSVEGAHSLGYLPRLTQRDKTSSQKTRLGNLQTLKQTYNAAYLTLDHFSATDISRASIAKNILNPWFFKTRNLTPFGVRLVQKAFELGLLIDLSHTTRKSIRSVCKIARAQGKPVFASHAGSKTVMRGINGGTNMRTQRMLDDESIREIVSTGGCISVTIGTQFLTNMRYSNRRWMNDAPLSVFLEHYEKTAHLIGSFQVVADPWDHLSFGTDFDGALASIPWELGGAEDLPLVTLAMLERGWPSERIKKVYSGNFLRVWEKA